MNTGISTPSSGVAPPMAPTGPRFLAAGARSGDARLVTFVAFPGGRCVARVRYGFETHGKADGLRCPGCGAHRGRFHEPSCALEQCRGCRRPLDDCDCEPAREEVTRAA